MNKILLLCILLLLFWSCSDTAGGGTEGGNVEVAGTVESDTGSLANARVSLFPTGYNPNDTSEIQSIDTTTGADGSFSFPAVDTGAYVLRIASESGDEGFLASLQVSAGDFSSKSYSVKPVGTITLLFDTTIDTVGKYCYVPHTDINLPLSEAVKDASGRYLMLTYEKLPPGEIDTLRIWDGLQNKPEEVIAEDVVVTSGEQKTVGETFHWLPVQKTGMLLDASKRVHKMVHLGDTLWFATSAGLFVYPTEEKVWGDKTNSVAETFYDVVRSPYDNVLIGTATGAYAEINSSWFHDTVKYKSVGSNPVYGILVENSGRVWFALGTNGVVTVKGDESEVISQTALFNKAVTSVVQAEGGTLFFVDQMGAVIHVDDDNYKLLSLGGLQVKKIIAANEGVLWVLANETLYKTTVSELIAGSLQAVDLNDQIDDIALDAKSGVLFATTDDTKKLILYKETVQQVINFDQELAGDDCRLVVDGGEGFLYSHVDLTSFTYMY